MRYRYYDPIKNWSRIRPHLPDVEQILVRDFNKFTWGRWRKKFQPGQRPHQFESCGWWLDHRGLKPAYWWYVKHSACHWLVNHGLELARRVRPKYPRASIRLSIMGMGCCSILLSMRSASAPGKLMNWRESQTAKFFLPGSICPCIWPTTIQSMHMRLRAGLAYEAE